VCVFLQPCPVLRSARATCPGFRYSFFVFFRVREHGGWALLGLGGLSQKSVLAVSKRSSCVSSELLDISQDSGGMALSKQST
jgi:hypothetical protein